MSDLNDLSKPVTTNTEPDVLDTLRAHIVRAATWTGWSSTANKVAGIMSSVTAAVTGGRSLRLYRRNDANTADEEIVSLPGISVGGNAATASAAQSGSTLRTEIDTKAPLNSPSFAGTPTVPTAGAGSNTAQAASTAYVFAGLANLKVTRDRIVANFVLPETRVSLGSGSEIDCLSGNYFTKTIAGLTTLSVINTPSSGITAAFILDLTNGGSATIGWWSGVKWAGRNSAPVLTASGRDVLGFFTHDGGINWTGLVLGKDF